MTLPLDAAARAVCIYEPYSVYKQDDNAQLWDRGLLSKYDPELVERSYRQAQAAILAAATRDVLAAVVRNHRPTVSDAVTCACGWADYDNVTSVAIDKHAEHVADEQIAELLRREG